MRIDLCGQTAFSVFLYGGGEGPPQIKTKKWSGHNELHIRIYNLGS